MNDIKEVKNVLRMIINHIRPDGELSPFDYYEIKKLSQIAVEWREEEQELGLLSLLTEQKAKAEIRKEVEPQVDIKEISDVMECNVDAETKCTFVFCENKDSNDQCCIRPV